MPLSCTRAVTRLAFLLASALLFPTSALSQATVPSLVRDINPGLEKWESGESQPVAVAGGLVFFVGSDPAHGGEMWRSDGTEEGTILLRDIVPGPGSALNVSSWFSTDGFIFGDLFYFKASGDAAQTWWKTDGTRAGTVPFLPDLRGALRFFAAGETLYLFRNCPGPGACELWKSDGTLAGTVKVESLPPTATGAAPAAAEAGGLLFFSFPGSGSELWRSDGTAAGTFPIGSFEALSVRPVSGAAGGTPGTLLFGASNGSSGLELWKSDGTAAGTVPVRDIWPGSGSSDPGPMVSSGGALFFTAEDGVSGRELWKSDGTEAGTVRVADLLPGPDGSGVRELVSAGGTLFFTAADGTGPGLWKSDGTEAGTGMVSSFASAGYPPEYLTPADGLLLFNAIDDEHGLELWRSDGTEAGTFLVKDLEPGPGWSYPQYLIANGGTVYFYGMYPGSSGELWKSDGTEEGTVLVKELMRTESSSPFLLTVSGQQLFFGVRDYPYGRSLWKSDGTAAGTVLAHSSVLNNPGPSLEMKDFQGLLHFTPGFVGVWRTDGTPGGLTHLFGGSLSSAGELTEAGGRLFLKGFSPALDEDLYTAGTGLVKDLWPGSPGSRISELTAVNDALFFRTDHGDSSGLWRSDGTAPGTFEVEGVSARRLTRAGNLLYFTVFEESSWSYSLWRSDGSAGGTFAIASWSPGDAPSELTDVDGTLLLALSPGTGGQELWKSDGTSAGTVRVWQLDSPSPLTELTSVDGRLFFSAEDASGRELWTSDGTAAGTRRVEDIHPGPAGSLPQSLTEASGWLIFTAADATHGRELWMSGGTAADTFLVADIAPGALSSRPEEMTPWDNKVFFSADDGSSGIELWSFEIEDEPGTTDTPPSIEDLVVSPDLVSVGTEVRASVAFTDPDPDQAHTVIWHWGDGSSTGEELPPGPGGSRGAASSHVYTVGGFYTVIVEVIDETGRSARRSFDRVVVYDPEPSVKGAGWIPLAAKKGHFQISAEYPQNGLVPTGKVQFKSPGVDLRSRSIDLLVVSGPTAWLSGEGTLDGRTSCQFLIALTDGQAPGGGGVDRLRIRIWSGGREIFDNEPGTPEEAPPVTALGGGTIQVRP